MSTSNISSISKPYENNRCRSVFRLMKLLFTLTTPIAVGIFTVVTTTQNQNIARLYRDQDKEQAEDDQRETVYINYINDVAKFLNEKPLNDRNGLYIRTKTLAALRKLDPERKKQISLFLKDSELLDRIKFIYSGRS